MSSRKTKLIVGAILICVLGFVAFLILDVGFAFYLAGGTTNTYLYRYLVAQRYDGLSPRSNVDIFKYFPPKIPRDATNVRFYYWSPPGDVNMQLRCTLPASKVTALVAEVGPIAKIKSQGNEIDFYNQLGPGILQQVLYPDLRDATNRYYKKSSPSFTIYLIGFGDDKSDRTDTVSYEYGIAVNEKKSEVVYFMNTHAEGNEPSPASQPS